MSSPPLVSPDSLPLLWAFAIFFSFFCRRASGNLRALVALTLAGALLISPFFSSLPRLVSSSFIYSLFSFQISLSLFRKLLFDHSTGKFSEEGKFSLLQQGKEFSLWIGDFLWFIYPVVRADEEIAKCSAVEEAIKDRPKKFDDEGAGKEKAGGGGFQWKFFFSLLFQAFVKACLCSLIYPLSLRFAHERPENFPTFLILLVDALLFAISVVVQLWALDLISALLYLMSRGRYCLLSLHLSPYRSSSLHEFWSRRWNRMMKENLHASVFLPMRKFNFSPTTAAAGAFAVSGLMHSYLAHFLYGYGEILTFFFFLLNSLATSEDLKIARTPGNKFKRRVLLIAFLAISVPIYLGNTEKDLLNFLLLNPVEVPGLSKFTFQWFQIDSLLNRG